MCRAERSLPGVSAVPQPLKSRQLFIFGMNLTGPKAFAPGGRGAVFGHISAVS
jgi:hypothetical protein